MLAAARTKEGFTQNRLDKDWARVIPCPLQRVSRLPQVEKAPDLIESGEIEMKRVNFYMTKLVKESAKLYDLEKVIVRSPEDCAMAIRTLLHMEEEPAERFGIFTLNTKNKIIGVHILFKGSLNASIVHPREVFQAALLNNAASIICFHNHPSGDPAPSREDIEVTKRLAECGKLIGIDVLDHIIMGDPTFVSLKEKGYL